MTCSPSHCLTIRCCVSPWPRTWPGTPAGLGCTPSRTLHIYLRWCADRDISPLTARRVDVELFVRWLQEIRRLKPSTVSRRLSMVIGFYRTCVIDAVLEHSPAEYVRRPTVPPESPTLGLSRLQFEAILATARTSGNPFDFALVALLGLLGLRIFEACGSEITDLGEEHGHRVLRMHGKGGKVVLVPLPPAVGRAIDTAGGERHRPDPAQPPRHPNGPARRHPPAQAPGHESRCADVVLNLERGGRSAGSV
jgi:integrase